MTTASTPAPVSTRVAAGLVALTLACAWSAGCGDPKPSQAAPAASPLPVAVPRSEVDAHELLQRCIAKYAEAQTLDEEGVVEDYLNGSVRKRDVRLIMKKPNWYRIEVGGSAAVVNEQDVWTYSVADDRFGKYRADSITPALTAGKKASDGVAFLTLDLFARGSAALGHVRDGKAWRIARVEIVSRRPCYVLECRHSDRQGRWMTIWIDQDQDVIRAWEVARKGTGDQQWPVIRVECGNTRLNEPTNDRAFRISRPFTRT